MHEEPKTGKGRACCRDACKTRERILAAAKTLFSRDSYEHVGVREIAADAGVDAALINRYFGSKKELFAAVVSGAFFGEEHCPGDVRTLGERLARLLMAEEAGCCHEGDFDPLLLLLRSAVSPAASPIVSEAFHAEFVRPLAAMLGGDDAEVRAAVIAAYVIGLSTMVALLKSPAMRDTEVDKVAALLTTAVGACLADDEPPASPVAP